MQFHDYIVLISNQLRVAYEKNNNKEYLRLIILLIETAEEIKKVISNEQVDNS